MGAFSSIGAYSTAHIFERKTWRSHQFNFYFSEALFSSIHLLFKETPFLPIQLCVPARLPPSPPTSLCLCPPATIHVYCLCVPASIPAYVFVSLPLCLYPCLIPPLCLCVYVSVIFVPVPCLPY